MRIDSLPLQIVNVMTQSTDDGQRMGRVKAILEQPEVARAVSEWVERNARAVSGSSNKNLKELVKSVEQLSDQGEDFELRSSVTKTAASGIVYLINWITGKKPEESNLEDKLNLLFNGFETPEEVAAFIFNRSLQHEELEELLSWRDMDGRSLLGTPERLKVFYSLLIRLSNEQIKGQFEGKDYDQLPVSVRKVLTERRGVEKMTLNDISPIHEASAEEIRQRARSDSSSSEPKERALSNASSVAGTAEVNIATSGGLHSAVREVLRELEQSGKHPQLATLEEGKSYKIKKGDTVFQGINNILDRQGMKLSDDVKFILIVRKRGELRIDVM